jgi:hypothetical protein
MAMRLLARLDSLIQMVAQSVAFHHKLFLLEFVMLKQHGAEPFLRMVP